MKSYGNVIDPKDITTKEYVDKVQSSVPSLINDALKKAKDSGEFKGDPGDRGLQGVQGWSIVAQVNRNNSFTDSQWKSAFAATGHTATWANTSSIRKDCRVGDLFMVSGITSDTKNNYVAFYRSTTNSGDLRGTCIGSVCIPRGQAGTNGTNGLPGINGKTWKPTVDGAGNLTWTEDSSTSKPASQNIKGPAGKDGLTTSIQLGTGLIYTQDKGKIILPAYPSEPEQVGAAPSGHNHNGAYLAIAGGTLTGPLVINGNAASKPLQVRGIVGSNGSGTVGELYLQYGANQKIYLGNSGEYYISEGGSVYSGNAASATKLQTSRTINGTSFNGTGNITTANWGTARTLTIGNKGKSVDGSGNVSWSLSEIGASAIGHNHDDRYYTETEINGKLNGKSDVGHTHSYLPLSGGTLTGSVDSSFTSGSWINSVRNSIINGTYTTYGGVFSAPVKSGRVALSTYPASDDNVYLGYAEKGRKDNSFSRSLKWNAADGTLTTAFFSGTLKGNASSATNSSQLEGHAASYFAKASHTHDWSNITGSKPIFDWNTTTTSSPSWIPYWINGTKIGAIAPENLSVKYASSAGSVAWGDVTGKPGSYPPSSHNHDFITGVYISGGKEKPNYFGASKLKLQMLTTDWGWADTLWLSSYSGSDVKGSNQLVIGKSSSRIGFRRQNFDSTTWGTLNEIYHTGHKPTLSELGAAPASHTHSYLPLAGGTLSGVLKFGSGTTPTDKAIPFQIGYGKVTSYGSISILADTDSASPNGEQIQLAASVGISPSATAGLVVTKDYLKFNNNNVITANNIGSQRVSYAASAGNADTVDGHHFHWNGQDGQPYWLWGANEPGTDSYVYNPSNFSVRYATSAGGANRINQTVFFNKDTVSVQEYTQARTKEGFKGNIIIQLGEGAKNVPTTYCMGQITMVGARVSIILFGHNQLWFNTQTDVTWSGWRRLTTSSQTFAGWGAPPTGEYYGQIYYQLT